MLVQGWPALYDSVPTLIQRPLFDVDPTSYYNITSTFSYQTRDVDPMLPECLTTVGVGVVPAGVMDKCNTVIP